MNSCDCNCKEIGNYISTAAFTSLIFLMIQQEPSRKTHSTAWHLGLRWHQYLICCNNVLFVDCTLHFAGLESREYRDPSHWPRDTLYPQKLTLTSPTSSGRSVGIDSSRNKATESKRYLILELLWPHYHPPSSFNGGVCFGDFIAWNNIWKDYYEWKLLKLSSYPITVMTMQITTIGDVTPSNLVPVSNLNTFNICHTTRLTYK
jgi:hypothetical protein